MTQQPTIFDGGQSPVEAEPALLDAAFTELLFFVPGDPAPQGSKKPFRNQYTGRIQLAESSKKVGPWRERVAIAAHNAMCSGAVFDGAVSVTLNFVLPRPKSAPKRSTPPAVKRPDLDKLIRACLDAITGVVVSDDSRVISLAAYKRIAEIGETAGCEIRVEVCA
jgi:crossover junction endodeoxyribonuclease RusA